MTKRPSWYKYAYEKEPDIELLKQILEADDFDIIYNKPKRKAIRLKYQAMTTVPNLIEKTMSPEQLYHAQNPLWAREYTVQELYSYMRYKTPTNYNIVKSIIQMDSTESSTIKLIKNSEYGATERGPNDKTTKLV